MAFAESVILDDIIKCQQCSRFVLREETSRFPANKLNKKGKPIKIRICRDCLIGSSLDDELDALDLCNQIPIGGKKNEVF